MRYPPQPAYQSETCGIVLRAVNLCANPMLSFTRASFDFASKREVFHLLYRQVPFILVVGGQGTLSACQHELQKVLLRIDEELASTNLTFHKPWSYLTKCKSKS